MLTGRDRDVMSGGGELVRDLHPGGGRADDQRTTVGGELSRAAVLERGELLQRSGERRRDRGDAGLAGPARGRDDGGAAPFAALDGPDREAVRGAPDRSDRHALHERWRGLLAVALEEGDGLGGGHVPVGRVARVAATGQVGHPVRRQQPQRVPPLGPPRVARPPALEHDVVDAGPGEVPTHGQTRGAGAHDDDGDVHCRSFRAVPAFRRAPRAPSSGSSRCRTPRSASGTGR